MNLIISQGSYNDALWLNLFHPDSPSTTCLGPACDAHLIWGDDSAPYSDGVLTSKLSQLVTTVEERKY